MRWTLWVSTPLSDQSGPVMIRREVSGLAKVPPTAHAGTPQLLYRDGDCPSRSTPSGKSVGGEELQLRDQAIQSLQDRGQQHCVPGLLGNLFYSPSVEV